MHYAIDGKYYKTVTEAEEKNRDYWTKSEQSKSFVKKLNQAKWEHDSSKDENDIDIILSDIITQIGHESIPFEAFKQYYSVFEAFESYKPHLAGISDLAISLNLVNIEGINGNLIREELIKKCKSRLNKYIASYLEPSKAIDSSPVLLFK